jgi:hypothetical protein
MQSLTRYTFAGLAALCSLALALALGPPRHAAAQSYDPSGALVTSNTTITASHLTQGTQAPASTPVHVIGGLDSGAHLRAITTDAQGNAIHRNVTPTRHDFGGMLASGSTLLSSGAGVLLSAGASTSAALGANLCFYDGDPAGTGVLISAFNVATGTLGSLPGVSSNGIPYSNGLYVRAGSALVSCASLGTTLSLGLGQAVTIP